jgi:hypothetical protein
MYEQKARLLVFGGLVLLAAYAAGFLAGYLRADGLREQLSQLREKIQDLKNIFNGFDTGSDPGGVAGDSVGG